MNSVRGLPSERDHDVTQPISCRVFVELASKRGLKTWPRGASWPAAVQTAQAADATAPPDLSSDAAADAANVKLAQTQESALAAQTDKQESTESREMPSGGMSYVSLLVGGVTYVIRNLSITI